MLTLNINPILKAKGVQRPFSFLVKAGFSPHAATQLVNGQVSLIKIEHIERLCAALYCEPSDLFLYSPSSGQELPPGHPLHHLAAPQDAQDLDQTLLKMPYKVLKQATQSLVQQHAGQDKE